jgi:hypothetical protein
MASVVTAAAKSGQWIATSACGLLSMNRVFQDVWGSGINFP